MGGSGDVVSSLHSESCLNYQKKIKTYSEDFQGSYGIIK